MLRLKKPLLLLLALSVVGVSLTSAQAMDELFAARQRDQDRRVRNNPGDDGVAFAQLRERLHRKWQEDLEAARRKRKRINLGQKRRNKRKEGIQAPVAASGQYVYFPSGSATDAKFLVLAGPVGTGTLVNELNIKLAAPSTATSVDLAIFDGDMAGAWDQGTGNLTYTLYRDPNADGTGTVPVPGASWTGAQMTDNAWTALTDSGSVNGGVSVPVDAGAQSPSGNYFYVLKIQLSGTSAGTAACMKFRTNASVRLEPQDSFTIIGALGSTADLNRVYPNYPSLTPTTYDGVWDLFTYVPLSLEYDPLDNSRPTAFEVWDGDFDLGDASLATNDTDDANTPNSVSLLPDWASSTSPVAEGVAVGRNGATGAPQDDAASLLFQRAPSVRYDVTDPSGVRYFNLNPSGNQEWERFRIETNPFTKNSPSVADAAATGSNLPAGVYQVHIDGLDMANLNALRFEHDILGVDEHGNPVQPLLPYNLGDTVWLDADGDGTQNGGELGIAGVNVTLLDDSGNVLLTDVTDASGLYSFNVAAGTYTVRVEASNFVSGNPLAGLNSTTGGQEITGEITTANVLTFDYGYRGAPSGSIGDFVWLDVDGDGIQDDGEPGIGGVTVTLGGDSSATTTTDVNGFYLFTGLDTLAAHNYTVTVSGDPLTGLTQTFDSDTVATPNTSSVAVAIGSNDLAQDFGFRGTGRIGDLIWLDANGDNTYTLGTDAGLAGVRVNLTWDYNGDGSVDLKQSTTTDLAGAYLFSGLPPATAPGSYTVRVDTNTLPYGVTLVADPDGAATPSYSTLTLASGAANLLQDFGYSGSGSIGDLVWHDADGDGVKDTGESGIANVGLTLTADFDLNGTTDYQSTTRTNASGLYLFSGLGAGRYRVTVNTGGALSGWTQTYDLDGTGTANTAAGALSARASNLSFDFGYNGVTDAPASVGDFVWIDGDGDGVQDSSELGLSGVQVKLYNTSNVQVGSTQTTNSTGYYAFTNLAPADYYVTFTLPSGYVFAGQDLGGDDATDSDPNTGTGQTANFTLAAGQNLTTVDAGAYQTASVGDYIWVDANRDGVQTSGESGLAGVVAQLYTSTNTLAATAPTTGSSGAYSFTNVTPGTYYVKFTLPATYAFTTINVGSDDSIDSDAVVSGNPLIGDTAQFTLAAGDSNTTVDAGVVQSASVGDIIWIDNNTANNVKDGPETGLAGVVARLYSSADVLLATAPATDASGAYSFGGLAAGTYYIIFTLPNGYTFVTQDGGADTVDSDANATTGKTANFTLTAGQNRTDIDAGVIVTTNNSVGDFVWNDIDADGVQDAGEAGLEGVSVQLFHDVNVQVGSTIVTGASGAYLFSGAALVNDTDYYVKFTLPGGYTFTGRDLGGNDTTDSDADTSLGTTATFSLTGGTNITTLDAGAYSPASVGDFVWLDANSNGVQDYTDDDNDGLVEATDGNGVRDPNESGEAGLADVSVKLFTSGNSQVGSTLTTTSTGAYSFTGLAPGSYYVEFTLPSGYVFTSKDQGGNDAKDSDADTSTGKTATFTLASGTNPITWDAGAYAPASVGNFLWEDTDEDGVQDGGEPGLAGVAARLFSTTTGTQVGATQTTTASGAYSFTNLAPGAYYVVFSLPDGYAFSARDQGADDALDSDVDPNTGVTATFTLASGANLDTVDAGASSIPSGGVGNNIWVDANQDGIFGAESLFTGSVTVKLFTSAGVQLASQTTTTGVYGFTGLDAGSYYVTFTLPAGNSFSSPDQGGDDTLDSDVDPGTGKTGVFSIGRGETRNDIDAGVSASVTTASVGNFIWSDLDGDGIQDFTDNDGDGMAEATDGNGVWDVGEPREPGLTGASVKLYNSVTNAQVGATQVTTSTGAYSFTGLSAGSFYVKVTLPAGPPTWSFTSQGSGTATDSDVSTTTGQTANFTLGNGQARTDIDAGAVLLGSIGQVVWYDFNRDGIWQSVTESGLSGVTVTLIKPDGTTVTTTTSSTGAYLFTGLRAGSYSVVVNASTISTAVIPAASLFRTHDYDGFATSPDIATYELGAAEDVRFMNFGYSTAPKINTAAPYFTFTIGGWGAEPRGGNAGGRLHTHFAAVYPGGVQIGTDAGNADWIANWTSAQAVTNYLPDGAVGATLSASVTNATTTPAGVLGSQLLAVRLARDFSAQGVTTGFRTGLASLKLSLAGNVFSGKTVDEILALADKYVADDPNWQSGSGIANSTPASAFTVALTAINENYDNGTVDHGHLIP